MSIAPVESFPPQRSEQLNTNVGSSHSQSNFGSDVAAALPQPVSGAGSKQENSIAKNVPSTYELPQDVVEVHQDPEIKDQVIIQYLDQSKNLVLQVPSNQELGVERGIAQEFRQAAKLRATESAAAASGGGKNHGDQL
jgi:phage baseplate assembly protein W